MLGPDRHFIKYQADAHLESFEELSVFSGKFFLNYILYNSSIVRIEKQYVELRGS